jgi:CDP-glucose 4,6-dehydratase
VEESLADQRILVTGHTGFKGAWLCQWLELLGANVAGFSLPAEPGSLYDRGGMGGRWEERLDDIRSFGAIHQAVQVFRPDLVIHLAAQPLVSASYQAPLPTFETNVMGTVHVLEAVRQSSGVKGCVVVTTDKVYRPRPEGGRHTESDPLGAHDPYSASKAAAEHVTDAWRGLIESDSHTRIVAARAGNVIGGGDFAPDRLVPDLIRAFSAGVECEIRHPQFTRPWQHVLDPLSGYLILAARILKGEDVPPAVNFGPQREEPVSVVADLAAAFWGEGASWTTGGATGMKETPLLALDSELAYRTLGWQPTWGTAEAVGRTVAWWKQLRGGSSPYALCRADIEDFMSISRAA